MFSGIIAYLDTVKGFKMAYSAFFDIDTHHRFMFFRLEGPIIGGMSVSECL